MYCPQNSLFLFQMVQKIANGISDNLDYRIRKKIRTQVKMTFLFISKKKWPFYDFAICERSVFNNFPSDLMPHNTRTGKWNLSFYHMEIWMAHAAGCTTQYKIRVLHNTSEHCLVKPQQISAKKIQWYKFRTS